MNQKPITVQTIVNAPIEKVWEYWSAPEHIVGWAFPSVDWEARDPENDLRAGGKFKTHMAAKDGSAGFDFAGAYTAVREHELIAYDLGDGRHVKIEFTPLPEGVEISQTFDPENENPPEFQRSGWQAILVNFKEYAEGQ